MRELLHHKALLVMKQIMWRWSILFIASTLWRVLDSVGLQFKIYYLINFDAQSLKLKLMDARQRKHTVPIHTNRVKSSSIKLKVV